MAEIAVWHYQRDISHIYVIPANSLIIQVALYFMHEKLRKYFWVFLFLKSLDNFWQNEPYTIIIGQKLVSVVWLELCKEISENFIPEQFKFKKFKKKTEILSCQTRKQIPNYIF